VDRQKSKDEDICSHELLLNQKNHILKACRITTTGNDETKENIQLQIRNDKRKGSKLQKGHD
jgi:hypothetical protein